MALFNIFLQNDDPKRVADTKYPPNNELPGDWVNEFVHKDDTAADLKKLDERVNEDDVKKTFIKEGVAKNFQTSVVLSKKILDIMMRNPDFEGIRIFLALDEKSTPKQPKNCFIIIPVDENLENITEGQRRKQSKRSNKSSKESSDTYYTEDATGCPPRSGCTDVSSFQENHDNDEQ